MSGEESSGFDWDLVPDELDPRLMTPLGITVGQLEELLFQEYCELHLDYEQTVESSQHVQQQQPDQEFIQRQLDCLMGVEQHTGERNEAPPTGYVALEAKHETWDDDQEDEDENEPGFEDQQGENAFYQTLGDTEENEEVQVVETRGLKEEVIEHEIDLTSEKIETIVESLKDFSLKNVPDWAKGKSDEQWKDELLKKLESS